MFNCLTDLRIELVAIEMYTQFLNEKQLSPSPVHYTFFVVVIIIIVVNDSMTNVFLKKIHITHQMNMNTQNENDWRKILLYAKERECAARQEKRMAKTPQTLTRPHTLHITLYV